MIEDVTADSPEDVGPLYTCMQCMCIHLCISLGFRDEHVRVRDYDSVVLK